MWNNIAGCARAPKFRTVSLSRSKDPLPRTKPEDRTAKRGRKRAGAANFLVSSNFEATRKRREHRERLRREDWTEKKEKTRQEHTEREQRWRPCQLLKRCATGQSRKGEKSEFLESVNSLIACLVPFSHFSSSRIYVPSSFSSLFPSCSIALFVRLPVHIIRGRNSTSRAHEYHPSKVKIAQAIRQDWPYVPPYIPVHVYARASVRERAQNTTSRARKYPDSCRTVCFPLRLPSSRNFQ